MARPKAALLAAKVYYHLGELNDALNYAMLAQGEFNVSEKSLFVNTLIGRLALQRTQEAIPAGLTRCPGSCLDRFWGILPCLSSPVVPVGLQRRPSTSTPLAASKAKVQRLAQPWKAW